MPMKTAFCADSTRLKERCGASVVVAVDAPGVSKHGAEAINLPVEADAPEDDAPSCLGPLRDFGSLLGWPLLRLPPELRSARYSAMVMEPEEPKPEAM